MIAALFSRLNRAVVPPARSSARRAQGALLTVSFCGLAALWFVAQSLVAQVTEAEIREQLAGRIFPLVLSYGQGGIFALTQETHRQAELSRASGARSLFLLLDDRGRAVSGNYSYVPPALQGLYPGEYEVVLYPRAFGDTQGEAGQAFAVSVFRISSWTLIVGESLQVRDHLRQRLRLVFAVVFLPTAILLGLISGRVTRRLFARLDKIAETARQVGAGRFAERIPLSEAEDEFDRLAQTLNQMLERNEALLHALRTTTASLAHDLRTPLTRTFARLEEVSQLLEMDETAQTEGIATRDGMRPALDQAMAEIERLRHTFDALTTIVHAESGISAAFPDSLRYAGLLEDVYDLYAPLAEEQGGSLSLRLHACPPKQRDAEVLGNRQLLFQAVSNLVENSLAHAKPSRSPLTIALFLDYQEATAEHPATWRLGVRDNGSGVSEPIQQRALAGFLHKPAPKSADDSAPESAKDDAPALAETAESHGLGLILASAVARLCGGELVLTNAQEQFSAELVLPDTTPASV